MNWPPCILRIRVVRRGRRRIALWLPLFLLWPLLLALAPLLLFVMFLYAIRQRHGGRRNILRSLPVLCGVLCALRGLRVHVGQRDEGFLVSFI